MNSTLLQNMGMGNFDPGYLVIAVAVAIILLLIVMILLIVQIKKVNNLKSRLNALMEGKDGKSLEEDILSILEDNKYLKTSTDTNRKDIRTLFKNMESTYQKLGLVKYDAFQQMGGKLSFCIALLNENNDGFILNSVHSTEGCYSYTKEIRNGSCSLTLGKEEEEALDIAMGGK